MKRSMLGALLVVSLIVGPGGPALFAADSQGKDATPQGERGARQTGGGEAGEGAKEKAREIGNTAVEGVKTAGEKLKEAGRAAEPQAKKSWESVREGAIAFARSMRDFFARLFASSGNSG